VWRDRVAWTVERLGSGRKARLVLIGAAWVFAACCGAAELTVIRLHPIYGLDLKPIYAAGVAALHHRPIYDVRGFVYPPTAALAAIPFTIVSFTVLSWLYLGFEYLVVVGIASVTVSWFVPRRWLPVAAGAASGALLFSHLAVHSLWLENVSLVVAAAAMIVIWLFGREHWLAGCTVLVLSVLLKPLLVPLVLIPLLARRPRPLLLAGAGGTALLLISLPLTTGLSRLPHVVRRLSHGSVLVGRAASNNLSIRGVADYHGFPTAPTLILQIAICAVALWVCLVQVRSRAAFDVPRTASLAALLLLATFLAGALSEVHYLFVTLPGACAGLVISSRPGVRIAAAIGLCATLVPLRNLPPSVHQGVLVLSEVAFFASTALALTDVKAAGRTTEPLQATPLQGA
jgi:Glycosyltransferase family 87